MISVFGIGLSAIRAFGRKMEGIAENVANMYSEGYKNTRTTMKEQEGGGVIVEVQKQNSSGHGVDLTKEIPQSIIAQRGYEANLKTIQTEDEVLGTLIDILE